MGCDGGTIPKRNEIVKNKQKDQAKNKDDELTAKWQHCSLSGLKLETPIVACKVGRLYNKTEVIKHLLVRPSSKQDTQQDVERDPIYWIRKMSDFKELKLKVKDDSSSSKSDRSHKFVCPISGLEWGGKYKFYYLFKCGCVFSERALKEVPNEKQCIVCYKPYEPETDLIVINGDSEETNELKRRLLVKLEESMAARKTKKRAHKSDDDHGPHSSGSHLKKKQMATKAS